MKSTKKLFITLLSIVTILSCQVGLGEAVDTIAPVITITAPDANQSVQGTLTISGIAQDNIEVNEIYIDVEHQNDIVPPIQFKIQNMELFQKNGEEWITSNSGNINGTEKIVNWSVDVELNQGAATSGDDYSITVYVTDLYGNESKNSKETRTVTVDFNNPKVSVNVPSLIPTYTAAKIATDGYTEKNTAILSQLYNGIFVISGNQEEDSTCDHINIFLDSEDSDDISMYEDKSISEIHSNSKLICHKVVDDKNQRIWEKEFDVNTFPLEYRSGKHTVRIVTQSFDAAQNTETKCQGWFTIWNEADKPWIIANFGSDTPGVYVDVQPGCELYGQAYDDDGLSEITIEVYKDVDGNWSKVEANCETIDLSTKNFPTYYLWTVKSLSENVKFYAKVKCKDKYWSDSLSVSEKALHESEEVYQYMSVLDKNPPVLFTTGTEESLPMTGEKKFILTGYVEDDGEIEDYIKVVRIADDNDRSQVSYFSKDCRDWTLATTDGFTITDDDERKGNKLWKIPLDPEKITGKTHRREFKKEFTFDNLGINGSSTSQIFGTQKFIIYAQDKAETPTIELVTISGDTEKPSITIDSIQVNTNKPIDLTDNLTLEPFKSTDKVVLSGSWSDNTDVLKKSNISLSWEGISGDFGITLYDVAADEKSGKWKTKPLTPPVATTAVIYAEITDWAKNIGKSNKSFYISSSLPSFERISSDTVDGSYKAGDIIKIYMEFNKDVKFKDDTPSLILNTNGEAIYTSGNGTSKHIFTYTVKKGENTETLNVKQLISNNTIWCDKEVETSIINDMRLENITNLGTNRSITIDTTAPIIESVAFSTAKGNYSEGSEIFMSLTFNETVDIENLSDIQLKLNSGENVKTDSVTKAGPNSVLFKYKVGKGENTPENDVLSITGIEFGNSEIKDIAGNILKYDEENDNAVINKKSEEIIIDTTKPEKPEISLSSNDQNIYAEEGVTVTINFKENDGIKKYSLNGDEKSVTDYTDQIKLLNKGTYTIIAYQEDKAGNKSDLAVPVSVTLDRGNIITSITADKPDATYKTGDKLQFIVNYRKEIKVSENSYLILNTSPKREAKYKSGSGTKKLYFEYIVSEGDTCSTESLRPESFVGTITDLKDVNITKYTKIDSVTKPNRFIDNKEIYIITKKPEVTKAEFSEDGKNCIITFSSNVNKKEGNIIFTQDSEGYRAPVVLSESEYTSLLKEKTKDFYEEGTNGAYKTGDSDLTKKYILKYDISDTDENLVTQFISETEENALVVSVPLYSKAVTIEKNVMKIDISGAYKLPVKGASYSIKIPAGLINDDISQDNEEKTFTKKLPGCEKPVVRIEKQKESFNESNDISQPLTAKVKMSCQTPLSDIYYVDGSKRYTQREIVKYLDTGYSNSGIPETPADPSQKGIKYTSEIQVGSKVIENDVQVNVNSTDGLKVFYRVKGTKDSEWSEDYFETAYKTVIIATFDPVTYNNLWLRGGDAVNGGVSTPDFPFSWNSDEYSKVRAMTKDNNKWYWVTWNISTTAYVGFLAGDLPDNASTNGPENWIWATQAFVGYKANTPVYPGESYVYDDIDRSGNIAFQGKHKESR